MKIQEKALLIVVEAEEKLRKLMADTLSEGDYRSLAIVAGWAGQVSSLISFISKGTAPDAGDPSVSPANRVRPRRKGLGTYPRFLSDRDRLVKIGWSKKKRKEYEQRAPRTVLDALVGRLEEFAGNGQRFRTEDILPLSAPAAGQDVPSYQSYLCLAWLRHIGLIKKYGRTGYGLTGTNDVTEQINTAWDSLPDRAEDFLNE